MSKLCDSPALHTEPFRLNAVEGAPVKVIQGWLPYRPQKEFGRFYQYHDGRYGCPKLRHCHHRHHSPNSRCEFSALLGRHRYFIIYIPMIFTVLALERIDSWSLSRYNSTPPPQSKDSGLRGQLQQRFPMREAEYHASCCWKCFHFK